MVTLYLLSAIFAFIVLASQLDLSWLVILFLLGLISILLINGQSFVIILGLTTLFTALLLARLIYLGSAEFSDITHKLGKQKTSLLLLKTFWRWLPLLLFALSIVAAIVWRDTYIRQLVYDTETTEEYACKDERSTQHLVCKETDSFESDMHALVQRLGDTFSEARQDDVYKAIAHIESTSKDFQNDLPKLIFQGDRNSDFNDSQPLYATRLPDSLQPPDCPWFLGYLREPTNCIKRDLFTPLNKGYTNVRKDVRTALEAKLRTMDDGIKGSSDEVLITTLQAINNSNNTYLRGAHKTLDLLFLKSKISTIIFYAFMLFLLLRIFLYVFTRFAFDSKHGAVSLSLHKPNQNIQASILSIKGAAQQIQVEELGNEVSLDLGNDTWYATKHRKVRYAQKGKPGFPMPLRLLFRRLTTGSYYLYRFGKKHDCPRLEPYADDVTHFIKVSLADSDKLCISLKNLVAFSESTQLESLFSPKFSVFFKHSLFFTVAKGPGQLLLRVDGGKGKVINGTAVDENRLKNQKSNNSFFNPVDLIAFDANGSYNLAAQHDLISVYTEGHTIRPQGNSLTIRQVHDEKGTRSILSSMRKLLLFLLPV